MCNYFAETKEGKEVFFVCVCVVKLRHNWAIRSPDHCTVIRRSNPAKIRWPSADLAPILDSSGGDPANLTRS